MVGFFVGVAIFRLAADPSEGFADLASLAGSLFTYAPVGALTGLALGLRKRPWPWAKMAIAALILAAIPVLLLEGSSTSPGGASPPMASSSEPPPPGGWAIATQGISPSDSVHHIHVRPGRSL